MRTRLMISGLAVAGTLLLGACASGEAPTAPAAAEQALVTTPELPDFGPEVGAVVENPGMVLVGMSSAPTTIDVYVDFQCPPCAQFDALYGDQLSAAIAAGDLAVRYHHLNFLDPRSASGDYSSRAAGAALCMAQDSGDHPHGAEGPGPSFAAQYVGFHSALFDAQPRMGQGPDPTDARLGELAAAAGASERTVECVSTGASGFQARAAADVSNQELATRTGGQVSTPSVFLGEEAVDFTDPEWIAKLTG